MLAFIGDHFVYLVLAAICTFMAVLATISVSETIAMRQNRTS